MISAPYALLHHAGSKCLCPWVYLPARVDTIVVLCQSTPFHRLQHDTHTCELDIAIRLPPH